MKLKIKQGIELLSSHHESGNTIIINLIHRWRYLSFKQKGNHLIVKTTDGELDFVFTGETPKVEFESFEKDQVIFRTK